MCFDARASSLTGRIHMDDTDTASIELEKSEARKVINALSEYEAKTSGREDERVLNVESLLQREFGFEEGQSRDDRNISDVFSNIFNDDHRDHEIQLSRTEATEVVRALDDLDGQGSSREAETVTDLRTRFAETFDLGGGRTAGR